MGSLLLRAGYGSQLHDDDKLPMGTAKCITFSERKPTAVTNPPEQEAQAPVAARAWEAEAATPMADPAEAHYREDPVEVEDAPSVAPEAPLSAVEPSAAGIDPDDPVALWQALQAAVRAGRCRLILLAFVDHNDGVVDVERDLHLQLPREEVRVVWE